MNRTKLLTVFLLAALLVPTAAACHRPPIIEPEPEPEVKMLPRKCVIHMVGGASQYIWNGRQWVYNTPVVVVVDDTVHLYYY